MRREVAYRGVVAVVIAAGCITVVLAAWDAYQLRPHTVGQQVFERLGESGVDHPVTAVLLNFRAYDTLLEIVVLTVAFWGAWSLDIGRPPLASKPPGLLLQRISAVMIPVALLLAAYLLWAGAHRPGGEFQAGAVVGAAGILSLLVGRPVPGMRRQWLRRLMVVIGATVFVGVAAIGGVFTGDVFGYAAGTEKPLMLVIDAAAALSVGFILVALFAGSVGGLRGVVHPRAVDGAADMGAGDDG